MKLSELYSEYFANWISGGSLVRKDNISLLGIKPLFDRFVTNKFISKVWMVRGMPVDCKYNLTDLIRNEMFLVHPSVRTTVHFCCEPINISVRSNIFMRQFENISAKFHEFQDFFDSLTEEQKLAGVYDVNPKTGKKYGCHLMTWIGFMMSMNHICMCMNRQPLGIVFLICISLSRLRVKAVRS